MELLEAVKNGNLERVKLLVERGADVETMNFYGQTALMEASWGGYLEVSIL